MTDKSVWRMTSQTSDYIGFATDQKELSETSLMG